MTALTLLAKWTASSPSWKNMLMINDLLCNLNIFSMSHFRHHFWSESKNFNLCQAHNPNVICRAAPAGPEEHRLVCHHSVSKRTKWKALWFLGLSQTTEWGDRSVRAQDAPAPSTPLMVWTHWQDHLGRDGVPWRRLGPGAFRISELLQVHRSLFAPTAEDWQYVCYSSFSAKTRAEQRLG